MVLSLLLTPRQTAALGAVAANAGQTPDAYLAARAADLCTQYAEALDTEEAREVVAAWKGLRPETKDALLAEVEELKVKAPAEPELLAESQAK